VRTQEEIVTRFEAAIDDMFGFQREVLLGAMDYEHAKPFLKEDVTEAEWQESRSDTAEAARGYLDFAIGKIVDHRGISAGRSVEKLTEYAWLLGRDDVVAAMEAADYTNYGAPKVKAFAEGMGLPWPTDDPRLVRMAEGLPCRTDGCDEGCGR
jgi:hypothetical protein